MDLVVGRVAKAHGVTGEVVVDVRTDDPDTRFAPGITLRGKVGRNGPERPFVVESVRDHAGRLLVRLEGVAEAVDWDGRLVVRTEAGVVELASGDVRHVRRR